MIFVAANHLYLKRRGPAREDRFAFCQLVEQFIPWLTRFVSEGAFYLLWRDLLARSGIQHLVHCGVTENTGIGSAGRVNEIVQSAKIFSCAHPCITVCGGITPGSVACYLKEEGGRLREKGESHYYAIRERFNAARDTLDFLFLNRACFNGVMRLNRKGGLNTPFCRKPERYAPACITKIVNQVRGVRQILQLALETA